MVNETSRIRRRRKKRELKKQKKLRKKANKQRLDNFSKKLETNLPRSEDWFRKLYKSYFSSYDKYNSVFAGHIPDVINKEYRYIIEIDGSIHNRDDIKKKDRKKENIYKGAGYKVIRIVAYNEESFKKAMQQISKLRGKHYKPAKIYTKEEITTLQNTISGIVKNADSKMSATESSP